MQLALTVWLEVRNGPLNLGGIQQVDLLQLIRWTRFRPSGYVVSGSLVRFVYSRTQDAGCACHMRDERRDGGCTNQDGAALPVMMMRMIQVRRATRWICLRIDMKEWDSRCELDKVK